MKNKIILLLTIISFSYSSPNMIEQINNSGNNNIKNNNIYGKYIPYLQLPQSIYVQRKRFELNTINLVKIYEKYFKVIYDRKKILNNVFDISILKKPVTKILKSISHIYVNPVYIQQIILPKKYKITSAVSSVKFDLFKFQNNELHLKANSNFSFGNIIVYYTDGKNNYSMNILVDNYIQKRCILLDKHYFCKKKRDKFSFAYENFALIYYFKDIKPLDKLDVIALYEHLTNKKITSIKNNSFVTFEYKGITYFIYRDDKNGDIIVDNKKFFVRP